MGWQRDWRQRTDGPGVLHTQFKFVGEVSLDIGDTTVTLTEDRTGTHGTIAVGGVSAVFFNWLAAFTSQPQESTALIYVTPDWLAVFVWSEDQPYRLGAAEYTFGAAHDGSFSVALDSSQSNGIRLFSQHETTQQYTADPGCHTNLTVDCPPTVLTGTPTKWIESLPPDLGGNIHPDVTISGPTVVGAASLDPDFTWGNIALGSASFSKALYGGAQTPAVNHYNGSVSVRLIRAASDACTPYPRFQWRASTNIGFTLTFLSETNCHYSSQAFVETDIALNSFDSGFTIQALGSATDADDGGFPWCQGELPSLTTTPFSIEASYP